MSANYFEVLGVKPLLGRTFEPADDRTGAPPVLVLSYEYWENNFGADAAIIGKTFELNDKVHTVIGVLPPVPQYPDENNVYMPTSACPFRSSTKMSEDRDMRMMEVFGRMKPGVTMAHARADLATIAGRLKSECPKSYPDSIGYGATASPLRDEIDARGAAHAAGALGRGSVCAVDCVRERGEFDAGAYGAARAGTCGAHGVGRGTQPFAAATADGKFSAGICGRPAGAGDRVWQPGAA